VEPMTESELPMPGSEPSTAWLEGQPLGVRVEGMRRWGTRRWHWSKSLGCEVLKVLYLERLPGVWQRVLHGGAEFVELESEHGPVRLTAALWAPYLDRDKWRYQNQTRQDVAEAGRRAFAELLGNGIKLDARQRSVSNG
jgi:hypothetical protein